LTKTRSEEHTSELQHHQPATRTQDTKRFVQGFLGTGHVPDAEGNRVDVERVVLERQMHRVTDHPVKAVAHRVRLGALAAFDQHRFRQVEHSRMAAARALEKPKGHIPGPTSHIQQPLSRARRKPIHHRILPDAVDAKGHGIIHDVVF